MPCCTLGQVSSVSASTVSHHLQVLEAVGLIVVTREGKFAWLRFERTRYDSLLRQLAEDAASSPPCAR